MERFRRRKSKTPASIEGTQKHNSFPTPVSESHFCSHGTTKEDSLMSEMRRNSSKRATGTPMKKLLAEEMLKETEAKRRSPSVIARLMGLDGMPSPQPVHRQHKMLSDIYQETNTYKGKSNRKSSIEQHKFKDVYEDLEASHVTNRHNSNNSGHSNKDSLLKFLEEPDSLYLKHMHDRQGNPSSHIAGLNPPNSENYEANSKGWKSERETSKKHVTGSRRRDCLLSYALQSLEPEEKDEEETLPTKIVVLKPNVWKLCDDVKAISSSGTIVRDHQLKKLADYSSVDFSDRKAREAREIAQEVTRQMKEAFSSGRLTSPFSGIRGYAGDESSFNVSECDSESESDAWSSQHWPSSSVSAESSVIREAKKRLSARWKSTHSKFQYEQVVGKGSTLGEMLAIPESETKVEMFDDMVDLGRTCDGLAGFGRPAAGHSSPFGISSRDGWKDGYVRNSSRLRSLPPLGHKTRGPREVLVDGGSPAAKEDVHRGRSRDVKGNSNSNKKEHCLSKNLSSRNKKSHLPRHMYEEEMKVEKSDSSDSMVSQIPSSVGSTSSVVNSEHEPINVSSASSDELPPMLRNDDSARRHEDSNSQGPSERASVAPSTEPEPESSESSKETDHRSPVSVLQVPSTEDVSSGSDCFESVSAGLQELRMQLQLLKMESQAYTESPMHEDAGPGSVTVSQEKGLITFSSWESSYIVDLLTESGFNETEPDTFTRTWYSQDCPLGPWVFNNLENKYTDESTGLRLERKLLFDRVNSVLVEIFQPSMNPFPWVKPVTVTVGLKLQKNGIEFEIYKVLERQEKEAYEDITEKAIDRETQWVDLGDGIDKIGMEIETLLIDELITELVTM